MNPKVSVLFPVYCPEPEWQVPMTACAYDTIRHTSGEEVEIIVVERRIDGGMIYPYIRSDYVEGAIDGLGCGRDAGHQFIESKDGPLTRDLNIAIERARGDYLLHTANDIFVRPGWLEALLEPFEKYDDCGISTLHSSELQRALGPCRDEISEGVYGPFMMFRKGWTFDEKEFPNIFSDTDLIMRIYRAGYRSYRNWRVQVQHLNKQTWNRLSPQEQQKRYDAAKAKWQARHRDSPLLVRKLLAEGNIF